MAARLPEVGALRGPIRGLTFRARLAWAYALALALVLVGFGLALDRGVAQLLTRQLDASLLAIAQVEATAAQGVWGAFLPGRSGALDAQIFLLSSGGSVVYRSSPVELPIPPEHPGLALALRGERSTWDLPGLGPRPSMRLLLAPASHPQGGPVAAVAVLASWGPTWQAQAEFRQLLLGLGLATLALALAGGWALAGRAMAPLRALTEAAEGVQAASDLSRRLPTPAVQDELGQLAAVLNGMWARLEAAFARERRFTADVAHELRTPLTVMRGAMEVALRRERPAEAYREALAQGLQAVLRLQALVEGMLALARLEAGQGLALAPLPLREAAREAWAARVALAQSQGVAWRWEGEGPELWVQAEGLALGRVLGNLMDNALRHAQASEVRVGVAGGGRPCVWVADDGLGVPEAQQAAIFGRFVRLDEARAPGGAGLGLAIARAAAEAMGGALRLEANVPQGAKFVLELQALTEKDGL